MVLLGFCILDGISLPFCYKFNRTIINFCAIHQQTCNSYCWLLLFKHKLSFWMDRARALFNIIRIDYYFIHVSKIILLGCEVGVVIESQTVPESKSSECWEQTHITKFLPSSVSSALACVSLTVSAYYYIVRHLSPIRLLYSRALM